MELIKNRGRAISEDSKKKRREKKRKRKEAIHGIT